MADHVLIEKRVPQPTKFRLDADPAQYYKRQVSALTGSDLYPGPLAASVSHSHVGKLRGFFASPKADGVRHALLLTTGRDGLPAAVCFDRSFCMHECDIWAPHSLFDGSIFDGEMLLNGSGTTFLVFDVICLKGERLDGLLFSERLSILSDLVSAPPPSSSPEVHAQSHIFADPSSSMQLLPKRFYPLPTFFERENDEYDTDGIVFVKDVKGLTFGPTESVLKWKLTQTLDVVVSIEAQSQFQLHVGYGSAQIDITRQARTNDKVYSIHLQENDLLRHYFAGSDAPIVVECECSLREGDAVFLWPIKRRMDKSGANSSYTLSRMLAYLEKPVSLHMLQTEAALSKTPPRGQESPRSTRLGDMCPARHS